MQTKILTYLDEHKDDLFKLLSDLLQINTENFITHGNEEAGQQFFADFCHKHGFKTDLYYPDLLPGLTKHEGYLAGRGTDKRPNVTAILPGRSGKQKITLAAHMDTMPIGDPNAWSVPALSGAMQDNKIFGRGSSDDKFGIAASIFAAMAIRDCGIILEDDVYITSYCDEEMGGGNGALATCLKYPSDIYINLDGGNMQVIPYAVGGRNASVSLHVNETLSSGERAFHGLKIMVEEWENFGKRRFAELHNDPIFCGTDLEKDAFRILGISSGIGGVDLNAAEMNFTYYTLTEQEKIEAEVDEVCTRIADRLKQMDITFDGIKNISRFFHPLRPNAAPADAELFAKLLESTYCQPVTMGAGCLSDLSVIHKYGGGIAFNTGLFKGFNEYGGPHQIDEYVDCDKFLAITKALALYLLEKTNQKGE